MSYSRCKLNQSRRNRAISKLKLFTRKGEKEDKIVSMKSPLKNQLALENMMN